MPDYRINPDFAVPDPIPANTWDCVPDPGTPAGRQQIISETCDRWKARGIKQMRATLTGPDVEGDASGYPPGLWLEGWDDEGARMLSFGAAWPNEDSAIWPPLTTAIAIEAARAGETAKTGSTRSAKARAESIAQTQLEPPQ